jgi:hypothetical protein
VRPRKKTTGRQDAFKVVERKGEMNITLLGFVAVFFLDVAVVAAGVTALVFFLTWDKKGRQADED